MKEYDISCGAKVKSREIDLPSAQQTSIELVIKRKGIEGGKIVIGNVCNICNMKIANISETRDTVISKKIKVNYCNHAENYHIIVKSLQL